jgi:hypothetical protein
LLPETELSNYGRGHIPPVAVGPVREASMTLAEMGERNMQNVLARVMIWLAENFERTLIAVPDIED